jgi:regulator of RNase E activity RraA
MKEEILKFIKENGMSTSDVADALGRKGHIEGIKTINKGAYAVGPAYYTYALHDSNWYTHRDFQNIPEGSIVFVDSIHTNDSFAIAGELMICYAQRKRGARGIVFNGSIRDVEEVGERG